MANEVLEGPLFFQVPQPQDMILAAGDRPAPIGREGHAPDGRVPPVVVQFLPAGRPLALAAQAKREPGRFELASKVTITE